MRSTGISCFDFSATGSDHIKKGKGNEDASACEKLGNGWAIGIVADGVGSCERAAIGSRTAADACLDFIRLNITAVEAWDESGLQALLLLGFYHALSAVKNKAKKDRHPLSAYETTLSAAIYNGGGVVFGHTGDGGIIMQNQFGRFSALTSRMKGETSNSVVPLSGGPAHWDFGSAKEYAVSVCLMTDGLFDVAAPPLLSMEENTLYVPFLEKIMTMNHDGTKTHSAGIERCVNGLDRVVDDKTLVCMINQNEQPARQEASYYEEPDWQQLYGKQMGIFCARENELKTAAVQQNAQSTSAEDGKTSVTSAAKGVLEMFRSLLGY